MFRITRGHHVQHIHFPLPVIRGTLNPDDDTAPEEPGELEPAEKPVTQSSGEAEQQSA